MKPIYENLQADLKKHLDYSSTFESLVDKNFFDLNNYELDAATNLFKKKLFKELEDKLSYIDK